MSTSKVLRRSTTVQKQHEESETESASEEMETEEETSSHSGSEDNNNNNNATSRSTSLIPEKGASLDIETLHTINVHFSKVYQWSDQIGQGGFGTTIYVGHHISNPDETLAIHICPKKYKQETSLREMAILRRLRHTPNVIRLIDFYIEKDGIYSVQDYAEGGDLLDHIVRRFDESGLETYTEKSARDLARVLFRTIDDMHNCGVVHRDLKPENLLLKQYKDEIDSGDDSKEEEDFMVSNFSSARILPHGSPVLSEPAGTFSYMAPEVYDFQEGVKHGKPVDMWSAGVILYLLLGGYLPFGDEDDNELLMDDIQEGNFDFEDENWKSVSLEAKSLICGLLTVDPNQRWTAAEALDSGWFKMTRKVKMVELSQSMAKLKNFRAARRWRSAFHAVRMSNRFLTFTKEYKKNARINNELETFSLSPINDNDDGNDNDNDNKIDSGENEKKVSFSETITSKTVPPPTIPRAGASLEIETLHSIDAQFHEVYQLGEKVGAGSYGTVFKCHHVNNSNVALAVKVLPRNSTKDEKDALREMAILRRLRNVPNIIHLIDFYVEENKMYSVQDFIGGGDLLDRIQLRFSKGIETYTEEAARHFAKTLLVTICEMHDCGVVHRDLKPENLLLKTKDDDVNFLLCDFGLARIIPKQRQCGSSSIFSDFAGTLAYMAPEILDYKTVKHGKPVDMWSAGCILYLLLGGYLPFGQDECPEMIDDIQQGIFDFDDQNWRKVSPEAKDLIFNLLTVDPERRWTAEEALNSDWFVRVRGSRLTLHDLSDTLTRIKEYIARRKLKSAFNAVRMINRAKKFVSVKNVKGTDSNYNTDDEDNINNKTTDTRTSQSQSVSDYDAKLKVPMEKRNEVNCSQSH